MEWWCEDRTPYREQIVRHSRSKRDRLEGEHHEGRTVVKRLA